MTHPLKLTKEDRQRLRPAPAAPPPPPPPQPPPEEIARQLAEEETAQEIARREGSLRAGLETKAGRRVPRAEGGIGLPPPDPSTGGRDILSMGLFAPRRGRPRSFLEKAAQGALVQLDKVASAEVEAAGRRAFEDVLRQQQLEAQQTQRAQQAQLAQQKVQAAAREKQRAAQFLIEEEMQQRGAGPPSPDEVARLSELAGLPNQVLQAQLQELFRRRGEERREVAGRQRLLERDVLRTAREERLDEKREGALAAAAVQAFPEDLVSQETYKTYMRLPGMKDKDARKIMKDLGPVQPSMVPDLLVKTGLKEDDPLTTTLTRSINEETLTVPQALAFVRQYLGKIEVKEKKEELAPRAAALEAAANELIEGSLDKTTGMLAGGLPEGKQKDDLRRLLQVIKENVSDAGDKRRLLIGLLQTLQGMFGEEPSTLGKYKREAQSGK